MDKSKTPLRAETYVMLASTTGKPIRKATKVIMQSGHEVCFTERMSKKEAFRQATTFVANRELPPRSS